MISSSVVVLPQPDSPTRPSVSPSRMSRSTPDTACTEPTRRLSSAPLSSGKVLVRPSTSSTARRAARGTAAERRLGCRRQRVDGFTVDAAVVDPLRPDAGGGVLGRGGEDRSRATGASSGSPSAHEVDRDRAAGLERATRRQVHQQRRVPRDRHQRRAGRWCPRGAPRRAARSCTASAAAANSSSTGAFSTGRPAYMTMTSSAVPATTPRSWVIMITAAPVSALASSSTSRICACTVTSRAVVGSSAMITFGLLAIAIAITTRCRIPPENSCGKEPGPLRRVGDADQVEQFDGPLLGRGGLPGPGGPAAPRRSGGRP